ncbi:MAG: hypothetical protein ACTSWN_10115 [Promethearchaeota archaeon]
MENPRMAANIIASKFKVIDPEFVFKVLVISPKYMIKLTDEFRMTTMEFMQTLFKLKSIKRMLDEYEIFNFNF